MVNDLRLAVQRLMKYPLFAAAVCLTMVVGIAVSNTIASLTDLLIAPVDPPRIEVGLVVLAITAAAFLLVVVCLTAANIVAHQTAIRCIDLVAASGSSDRTTRQLVIESLIHSLVGCTIGMLAAI